MAAAPHPPSPEASLVGLPLELRYKIFEHAAVRDTKPKKVLRYWFEKKEIKEAIAKQVADNPDGVTPVAGYVDDTEDSEMEDEEQENEDSEEDEDNDDDDDEDDMDNEDEDEDIADEIEPDAEAEDEGDEEMDGGDGTATQTAPPPPPAPVVQAHGKWRHIPKFLRMTQSPPPVELFLINKQINQEAKHWFYEVTVLNIDATGSFAHTSFFEEALGQIADAAFSPMENLRKAEVTFVWDTTWMRADTSGFAGAIFPALLRQRAEYVVKILQQAPDLNTVVVHWHDSAEDDELMNDTLMGFFDLKASIELKQHYIASDAKPDAKSIAGKRRIEFQNIADSGFQLN